MKTTPLLLFLLASLTLAPSVLSEVKVQEVSKQSLNSHSSITTNTASGSILAVRHLAEEHDDEEEHHGDEEEHHDDEEEHHDDEEEHHDDEEHHEHEDDDKPWGAAIGASLLVNVVTFIGVLLLVPFLLARHYWLANKNDPLTEEQEAIAAHRKRLVLHNLIPSFACGALLATAVFLIIPESINLLSGGHGEEGEHGEEHAGEHRFLEQDEDPHDEHGEESSAAWKFGTAFLGGFLLPLLLSSVFPHVEREEVSDVALDGEEPLQVDVAVYDSEESVQESDSTAPSCAEEGCDACETEKAVETHKAVLKRGVSLRDSMVSVLTKSAQDEQVEKPVNYRLVSSILIGDSFHNFADGIFIGNAFLLCDNSVAWAITAATIYHELAQELADFFLLTSTCHLPVWKALVLNFISGLSVLLGVVIILSIDVSVTATGVILAISAGVYMYLAATECMPQVQHEVKTLKERGLSTLCFICGAVPIGLVLLNHGHCEAEEH